MRLPVIAAMGGFNAAGRSSFHHAYCRTVMGSLSAARRLRTCESLGALMGVLRWEARGYVWAQSGQPFDSARDAQLLQSQVEAGTLVRRIEPGLWDVDAVPLARPIQMPGSADNPVTITLAKRDLPEKLPEGWTLLAESGREVSISLQSPLNAFVQMPSPLAVQAAGQLPSGFDPGAHYKSLHHPRGLQLAILAASDAINSLGLSWPQLRAHLSPDDIAVYSASVMSQLDSTGLGGMLKARLLGERVSSKQLALGLNTMPADFVNAYVLGSLGGTAGITGACATFLYNLKAACDDIQQGRRRLVLVGASEAPILPEVIEGYAAMSALATDAELARLPGGLLPTGEVNHRRASRPFGDNCGFTLAESAQYAVVMDESLALELGAPLLGAVPGVFVHADGYKKSISAPGAGNLLTMARATGLAERLAGSALLRGSSFVQAHGSSTPHNRTTESAIFDRVAEMFGIPSWPVAAVKSYLGHSLGPASGDQLASSLGVFAMGILPGIKTLDHLAADVKADRLRLGPNDQALGIDGAQIAFLNSKGFGGNNATACVVAPALAEKWLQKRHGKAAFLAYQTRREQVLAAACDYDNAASRGDLRAQYHFGEAVLEDGDIRCDGRQLQVPGFAGAIALDTATGYEDLIGD